MKRLDKDAKLVKSMLKELRRVRNFPANTCAASRHLELMATQLATGKPYPMLTEEPVHCAISMLSVLTDLYKHRTAIVADAADRAKQE